MRCWRLLFIFMLLAQCSLFAQPIIIDHNCTNLAQVPSAWIAQVKQQFRLAYGHTSHGSQIVSGMEVLAGEQPALSYNEGGSGGDLAFDDYFASGDLGSDGDTSWAESTRDYLNGTGSNRNVIMWSWCGGVSWTSEDGINAYLTAMTNIEHDYPNVTFIYMTGHLDGTGVNGSLNQRNNQIRQYCQTNGKVLFDFADIESYDPDGNYFLDKAADDGCNYQIGGNQYNWATEWCNAHPGQCPSCGCAHSEPINCYQKGKAFWWMMARIAGWNGPATGLQPAATPQSVSLSCTPNPANASVTITMQIAQQEEIELSVYNTLGDLVATVIPMHGYAPGEYAYRFNTSALPQGAYMAVAKSANGAVQQKFIVQR